MRKVILSVALVLATGALAQQASAQHVLAPKARLQAAAQQSAIRKSAAQAEQTVQAYITTTADADWAALEALGVHTSLHIGNVATATIPLSRLNEVAAVKGVTYIQTAAPAQQMLDRARTETGADKVSSGTELAQAYTGKGVVVGIVDAGFDYTHRAFYDANGELRIKRIWEQSNTPSGSYHSPEGYGYGTELTTQSEIEVAMGDITGNSHGTHVANIAAGSDDYQDGAYKGSAPDADIVLVSMGTASRDNVNLTNALAYIFDYAEAQGKPCVINLSLGNHAGPHDGTSTFDVVADSLQGPGRIIVGAVGNHRTDKFHVARTFTGSDDAPLRTFVSYPTAPSASNVGGDIEIWGSVGAEFEVELATYRVTTDAEGDQTVVYPSTEATQSVELGRTFKGTVNVSSEVSPLNGKPHVLLTSALTSIRNNDAWTITICPKNAGTVDIWADNDYVTLTSNGKTGFVEPGDASTLAEIGGTGKRILSVGAYTTRSSYTVYGGSSATNLPADTIGHLSSFSSCGPTADGRMKPEVTAPGCIIISALSQNDATDTKLVAAQYTDDSRTYQYGFMQGTSMSAPLVTGVVATWLQACPTLTPEQVHAIVSTTSRTDDYTATPTEGWGYGKLDAYAGLKKAVEAQAAGIATPNAPLHANVLLGRTQLTVQPLSSGRATATIHSANGVLLAEQTVSGQTTISTAHLPKGVYVLTLTDGTTVKTLKFSR